MGAGGTVQDYTSPVTGGGGGGIITPIAPPGTIPYYAFPGALVEYLTPAQVQERERLKGIAETIGEYRGAYQPGAVNIGSARIMPNAVNYGNIQSGAARIVLELKDDLIDFIEAKIFERQNLNISLLG